MCVAVSMTLTDASPPAVATDVSLLSHTASKIALSCTRILARGAECICERREEDEFRIVTTPSSSAARSACPLRAVVEKRRVKGGVEYGACGGVTVQNAYSSSGVVRREPRCEACDGTEWMIKTRLLDMNCANEYVRAEVTYSSWRAPAHAPEARRGRKSDADEA